MNAVLYARYSSDNQREESAEAQVRAIEEYAKNNDYTIIKKYIDRELTGTNDRRPEFQRMVEDSRTGFFNVVLIHKTDRFSRNKADSAIYKRTLMNNGVRVIPVAEAFISESPFGVVMEGMLEGWAEYYSLNLSSEVKKGQNENIEKFHTLGKVKHNGGKPPFGYVIDEDGFYEIDDFEAIAVKQLFKMYSMGSIYNDMSLWLDNGGYRTKYGKKFCKSSLNTLLNNIKYTGTYTYRNKKRVYINGKYKDIDNPDKIIIEGGIPAIIDKKLFEEVQRVMSQNSKAPGKFKTKRVYVLSGKLFCPICGSKLESNSYKGGRDRKHTYTQYKCTGRKKKLDCDFKAIDKTQIENDVCAKLEEDLFSTEKVDYITNEIYREFMARRNDTDDNIRAYKSKLDGISRKINNLVEAIASGLSYDSLTDKLQDLEHQKQMLMFEIKREEGMKAREFSYDDIKQILSIGKGLSEKTDKEKAMIVDTFVDRIIVSDKLEIEYKVITDLSILTPKVAN